jgi:hypothetical protein
MVVRAHGRAKLLTPWPGNEREREWGRGGEFHYPLQGHAPNDPKASHWAHLLKFLTPPNNATPETKLLIH